MLRSRVAPVATILAILASGCLSGSSAPAEQLTTDSSDQRNDAGDAGTIGGIVHDESFNPVPSAVVTIPASNHSALTDAVGAFRITQVPPGSTHVFAQKPGYRTRSLTVAVNVGETTTVAFQLEALPSVEPFFVTRSQRGVLGCGLMVRSYQQVIFGLPVCSAASAVVNLSQYEKSRLLWTLTGPVPAWQAGVFELQWTSTQALGSALWQLWEVEGCDGDAGARVANASGRSPLWVRINETQIERFFAKATEAACAAAIPNCNPEACSLQSRVQPGDDILGSNYPADVGFTFQQSYEIFLTEFYHDPGPPDFSAIPR